MSTHVLLLLCLCLTSYQQLRSYGDRPPLQVSSHRLVKPGIKPGIPGLHGEWFIHYTTTAPTCILNLLNKLREKTNKMWGLSSILSLFYNEFNKVKNKGAWIYDSIYQMTLNYWNYYVITFWYEITIWYENVRFSQYVFNIDMDINVTSLHNIPTSISHSMFIILITIKHV